MMDAPGDQARQVVDLVPGPQSSSPTGLGFVDGRLLFAAHDVHGDKELWSIPLAHFDLTPPTISATVIGTEGHDDFYLSDVVVTFAVEDTSPILETAGCEETTITSDGAGIDLTCTARSFGGTSTHVVSVSRDANPPELACEPSLVVEAASAAGTPVEFALPSVEDVVDPSPVVTASHDPGTVFPLGETALGFLATDHMGHEASCVTVVRVEDTTAPEIACPGTIVTAPDDTASFSVTATDQVDDAPEVEVSAASGSTFPAGATRVSATARDDSGNTSRCDFTVESIGRAGPAGCGCSSGATGSTFWPIVLTIVLARLRARRRRRPD